MKMRDASVGQKRCENVANRLRYPFEVPSIDIVESGNRMRVDIEHGAQISSRIEHRHDNFRSAVRVTGNMARERVHVFDYLSLETGGSGAADTLRELDLETADRPLVRSDPQSIRCYNAIKPHPTGGRKTLHQDGGNARHGSHRVGEILQERLDLSLGCSIQSLFFLCVHEERILAPR